MSLTINDHMPAQAALGKALRSFVSRLVPFSIVASSSALPALKLGAAAPLQEHLSIVRALMGEAKLDGEVADVVEWARLAAAGSATSLGEADARLATRAYIAGPALSVADPLAYFALGPALAAAGAGLWTSHAHLARWCDQLQHELGGEATLVALAQRPALPAAGTAAAAAAAAPAARPAAAGGEKKAAGGPAPPSDVDDPIAACQFLVGKIVDCWKHPDSEKLWCEKIDLGEASGPREIASGLQGIIPLDAMIGARVIVIANLKPRPLAGFMSNGMVLCGTGGDGKVEFVVPPAGAAVGERVVFEGHTGDVAEPNRMAKKKLWEAVAPELKVNGSGQATWAGIPFMTTAGPCTVAVGEGSMIR